MRPLLALILGTQLLTACTTRDASQGTALPADAETKLRAAVMAYDSAFLRKDTASVSRMLAPEYRYFTSRGGMSSREATMTDLADTSFALTQGARTDLTVTLRGTTAVVGSRWRAQGHFRDQTVRDDQRCGLVWIWEGDHWLLLSEHCTDVPGEGLPVNENS